MLKRSKFFIPLLALFLLLALALSSCAGLSGGGDDGETTATYNEAEYAQVVEACQNGNEGILDSSIECHNYVWPDHALASCQTGASAVVIDDLQLNCDRMPEWQKEIALSQAPATQQEPAAGNEPAINNETPGTTTTTTVVVNNPPAIIVSMEPTYLGPWAPSASGQGEDFEVTCNTATCGGVHLQIWRPNGQSTQACGDAEIHTFVEPGQSVTVLNAAGAGFHYPPEATTTFMADEIMADMDRRLHDTTLCGWIDLDVLISAGIVEVRFDRNPNSDVPLRILPVYGVTP